MNRTSHSVILPETPNRHPLSFFVVTMAVVWLATTVQRHCTSCVPTTALVVSVICADAHTQMSEEPLLYFPLKFGAR